MFELKEQTNPWFMVVFKGLMTVLNYPSAGVGQGIFILLQSLGYSPKMTQFSTPICQQLASKKSTYVTQSCFYLSRFLSTFYFIISYFQKLDFFLEQRRPNVLGNFKVCMSICLFSILFICYLFIYLSIYLWQDRLVQ